MLTATAAWVLLMVPSFVFGILSAYSSAKPSAGGYIVNPGTMSANWMDDEAMAATAAMSGFCFMFLLTLAYGAAMLVGIVLTMSIESKPSHPR